MPRNITKMKMDRINILLNTLAYSSPRMRNPSLCQHFQCWSGIRLYDIANGLVLYLPLFAFELLAGSFLGLPKKVRFILLLPVLAVPTQNCQNLRKGLISNHFIKTFKNDSKNRPKM